MSDDESIANKHRTQLIKKIVRAVRINKNGHL